MCFVLLRWAGLATTHLELYIKLFNKFNNHNIAEAQKKLLLEVLGDGIKKMTAALSQLSKSAASFNLASGQLYKLRHRLNIEFDKKSEFFESKMQLIAGLVIGTDFAASGFNVFGIPIKIAAYKLGGDYITLLSNKMESIKKFYETLYDKIHETSNNIHSTDAILRHEIASISDLRQQTTNTEIFVSLNEIPEFRDLAIEYAQGLIDKCHEYRKRHIDKVDLF